MSQSTIELPDPLEGSTGTGYAGADDLLAQLAGEEVDRLLSDAETGTPPARSMLATDSGMVAGDEKDEARETRERVEEVAGDEISEAALDDLFNQINGGPPAAELETHNSNREVEGSFHDRRTGDASADQAVVTIAEESTAVTASVADPDWEAFQKEIKTSAGDEEAAAKVAEPASVADALAAEMEEDERINREGNARAARGAEAASEAAVLEEGAVGEADGAVAEGIEGAPAVVIDEALAEPMEGETEAMGAEGESGPMPILVRILEWINSPLSGFSERVREALGKVAIVTMLNATAVLVYVLMFRKHP